MVLGISQSEHIIINDILKEYKPKYSFYYYGSRVKGTFNKTSDLDILIKGKEEMSLLDLAQIKESMDNSKLPYIVNFTDYNAIDKNFYNLIKDDLVLIEPDTKLQVK
jgi:predicted nucleotidyltransferase